MSSTILQTGGRVFQKFVANLTGHLTKPTSKFITDLLCGILFSDDLVLTNVASKIPHRSTITAIAKRLRRHLAGVWFPAKAVLYSYLALVRRRIDRDSLFIVDLTDIAKPHAKKMENIALVRDGDKGQLVTGYGLSLYGGWGGTAFVCLFLYMVLLLLIVEYGPCTSEPTEKTLITILSAL